MNMNSYQAIRRRCPQFEVSLADDKFDQEEAFRLRYRVFVEELGANVPDADHARAMEVDEYDTYSDHLILRDISRPEGQQIVGMYRLLQQEEANRVGGFYTETEFDLSRLYSSNRKMLELGRSCIAPEYRGTTALLHLWQAVGRYVADHGIEMLFGTASFQGTTPDDHAASLALLQADYLAPADLRPIAKSPRHDPKNRFDAGESERKTVQRGLPSLIKSYLRLGGCVGDGAFIDYTFNTTDICMLVDVSAISPRQRALYSQ